MKHAMAVAGVVLTIMSLNAGTWAADKQKVQDRVDAAGTVLQEIMDAPDGGLPSNLLDSAQCVAIVPSMLRGAFVVGAAYGKGVASCRTAAGWSAPAFFRMEGGSFGLQAGGQAVDYIMLVMNEQGLKSLLSSKFQLGADASVAAGPLGRDAAASTDWKMRAQILTYSRARGVFAGVSLKGNYVRQDKDDTREFYGHMVTFRSSLTGATPAPKDAAPFLEALSKYSPQPKPAAADKTSSEPPKKN